MSIATAPDGTEIYYEVRGRADGPTLFLGPPFTATPNELMAQAGMEDPTAAWVRGLGDDFRILVADLPRGVGQTGNPLGKDYSPDAAVADLVAVLDASGTDRAAWVGYSYGGAQGIQLTCRTDRVSALVVGGWPALNQPFARLLEVTTAIAESLPAEGGGVDPELAWSSVAFYAPLSEWPERAEVAKIAVPRMAFMGSEDTADSLPKEYATPLADLLRNAEPELRELGWEIAYFEGEGHLGAVRAEVALPAVQDFLRRALIAS
jgi:pimeloyl-ACP methyl ester carboxylesterase